MYEGNLLNTIFGAKINVASPPPDSPSPKSLKGLQGLQAFMNLNYLVIHKDMMDHLPTYYHSYKFISQNQRRKKKSRNNSSRTRWILRFSKTKKTRQRRSPHKSCIDWFEMYVFFRIGTIYEPKAPQKYCNLCLFVLPYLLRNTAICTILSLPFRWAQRMHCTSGLQLQITLVSQLPQFLLTWPRRGKLSYGPTESINA